ncbi:hypothetical protein SAMN05421504_102870 [Amycolatopsis xylanica]|uniref:Uncharacterized protein n=1 Tax=Amycolatopsis xylanica TaxID=589385 RepID=A0A1H3ABW2_9PSEU|nr:hypothetical protein [Amycolatopsis xylanica]SDX27190.1 hypothetical protein SAMN05421504_102870 [Amycolatopsis xylanica]
MKRILLLLSAVFMLGAGAVPANAAEGHWTEVNVMGCGGGGVIPIGFAQELKSSTSVIGFNGANIKYEVQKVQGDAIALEVFYIDGANQGQWFKSIPLTNNTPHIGITRPWGNNLANPKIRVQTMGTLTGQVDFSCGIV